MDLTKNQKLLNAIKRSTPWEKAPERCASCGAEAGAGELTYNYEVWTGGICENCYEEDYKYNKLYNF